MSVLVASRCRRRGVRAAEVRRDAVLLLRRLRRDGELSIALVGDGEIRELNRSYRRRDTATDVLAFPMMEGTEAVAGLLGDVVISLETAVRQAPEHGLTPAQEVRSLLVHGVLHLLGYDHERGEREARRMFRRQRELLRSFPCPAGTSLAFARAVR